MLTPQSPPKKLPITGVIIFSTYYQPKQGTERKSLKITIDLHCLNPSKLFFLTPKIDHSSQSISPQLGASIRWHFLSKRGLSLENLQPKIGKGAEEWVDPSVSPFQNNSMWATEKTLLLSIESWLVYRDPYIGLVKSPYNLVVEL